MKHFVHLVTIIFCAWALASCGGGQSAVPSQLSKIPDVPVLTGPPTSTSPPANGPSSGSYPMSISQRHVLTNDYLGGGLGTHAYAWSQVAPYVSWALTGPTPESDQMRALGIETYYYTDPNEQAPGDPMFTNDESTFAHDCDGTRISRPYGNKTMYLMNTSSSDLVTLWRNAVPGMSHYDAVQEDEVNTLWGFRSLPCGYTPQGWLQASINQTTAFGYPVIYNGAALSNMSMNRAPNVIGGMAENCYTGSSLNHTKNYRTYGSVWQNTENVELQMAQQRKLFFCLDTSYTDARNTALRLYDVASFLLTYDPGYSVLFEFFGTPSKLHVEPESKLVPMYPVIPAPRDISALQASSNVYGREYHACYVWGSSVGPCAVAVNTDPSSTRSFPYANYHHTLTLSGVGVLAGGAMSTNGAAPSLLAPLSAAIAFH